MNPGSAALLDIRSAIKEFQTFAGLNVTGDLDPETIELMATPRCGVRDKIGHDARRRKRYVRQGKNYNKNYAIDASSSGTCEIFSHEIDSE